MKKSPRQVVYAVLGYGSQGRAIAMKLRDSSAQVLIGLPKESKSRKVARKDNFREIQTVAAAVERADVIIFAFPDHLQPRTFDREIAPALRRDQTLLFLHGTAIAFGLIQPPADVDVIMLAPHAPGLAVREKYLDGTSISCFWAIHQNPSRKAKSTLSAVAKRLGIAVSRNTFIKTTFADEAVGDLFGEQAVLCGGLTQLIHAGFETLIQRGISPDNAYLEVCYQLDLIINLIKRFGIEGMFGRISVAAAYGSLMTGPKIIDAHVRRHMKAALEEITSGRFPRRLADLTPAEITRVRRSLGKLSSPAFERAARKFAR